METSKPKMSLWANIKIAGVIYLFFLMITLTPNPAHWSAWVRAIAIICWMVLRGLYKYLLNEEHEKAEMKRKQELIDKIDEIKRKNNW